MRFGRLGHFRFWAAAIAVALVPTALMVAISKSLAWTFYLWLGATVVVGMIGAPTD